MSEGTVWAGPGYGSTLEEIFLAVLNHEGNTPWKDKAKDCISTLMLEKENYGPTNLHLTGEELTHNDFHRMTRCA